MLLDYLRWAVMGLGIFLIGGTALSLSTCPHHLVRMWDFPRIQIAALLTLCAIAACWLLEGAALALFLIPTLASLGWHLRGIIIYTPLYPVQVKEARTLDSDRTFRLVTTNVLMENRQFARWLEVVRAADPDLILVAEVDAAWAAAMEPLRQDYPHTMSYPQDNYYGLVLWSRLELIDPRIEFLVQEDIPSFHVGVRLRDGSVFRLHGIHPRPPEPVFDQDSKPRDCELVQMGRAVKEANEAAVVAGDLNDVAWSHTTHLFQRLSGTLDPRVGRGLINSFHAGHILMRWPLDHVFHTAHFELLQIKRLEDVGSDHFPILVELALCPEEALREQAPPTPKNGDGEEADQLVERQEKDD